MAHENAQRPVAAPELRGGDTPAARSHRARNWLRPAARGYPPRPGGRRVRCGAEYVSQKSVAGACLVAGAGIDEGQFRGGHGQEAAQPCHPAPATRCRATSGLSSRSRLSSAGGHACCKESNRRVRRQAQRPRGMPWWCRRRARPNARVASTWISFLSVNRCFPNPTNNPERYLCPHCPTNPKSNPWLI